MTHRPLSTCHPFRASGFLAVLALSLSCVSSLQAQGKKGGGGKPGGDDPPPVAGKIYFAEGSRPDLFISEASASDGSGETLLWNVGMKEDPSKFLHAGARWILEFLPIAGELYPDGRQRFEIAARSETGFVVQLSDDPNLQPIDPWLTLGQMWMDAQNASPRWSRDDQRVSWLARRWGVDPVTGADILVEMGIYNVDLLVDVADLIMPLTPSRVNLDFPEVIEPGSDDYVRPAVGTFHWSSDGEWLTYHTWIAQVPEVFIANPASGTSTWLAVGINPRLCPDGQRILFQGNPHFEAFIWTMALDGSSQTPIIEVGDVLNNSTGGLARHAYWSPTGEHVVYDRTLQKSRRNWTGGLFRVPSTGGREIKVKTGRFNHVLGWRE